jgi:hypothetical protein
LSLDRELVLRYVNSDVYLEREHFDFIMTLPLKRDFFCKSLHEFEMGPEGILLRKV